MRSRVFFDQFDRIYVVNLRSRQDRRREMVEQVRLLGLSHDPRVQFFEAVRAETSGPFLRIGSHGAFLSHLSILKSHCNDNKNVMILQDDCDFFPGAAETEVAEDWDILYGGYQQLDIGDLQDSGIQGAHCMAFQAKVIPRLVAFLEAVYAGSYRPNTESPNTLSRRLIAPPIDGAIVWFRRANPDVRTVFHKISYQRPSRTDIGDPSMIDAFPRMAAISRFFLRWLRRVQIKLSGDAQT